MGREHDTTYSYRKWQTICRREAMRKNFVCGQDFLSGLHLTRYMDFIKSRLV